VCTCLLTVAHHHNGCHTPCDGVKNPCGNGQSPLGNPIDCHSSHLLSLSTVLRWHVHLHIGKANNNIVLNDLLAMVMPTILITILSGWVGPSGWARRAAATLKAGAACALAAALRGTGGGASAFATIASGALVATMRGTAGVCVFLFFTQE
jgi:hypothetical protein